MRLSALNDFHIGEKGRMVDFAGWSLPLDYGSAVAEAKAVRTAAGLFDVSHMGRFRLEGPAALSCLQALLTNDASRLQEGGGQYTLLCSESGGIIDDLIVFKESAESWILIVNASNLEKDKAWIEERLEGDVRLSDYTPDTALMALQGPAAADIVKAVGCGSLLETRKFHFARATLAGADVTAYRTGYTGEDGFEIETPRGVAAKIWNALLEAGSDRGLKPCGLASRDILRIEAGLSLYGHEISESTTPVEAGLMRWVKLQDRNFVGRDRIESTQAAGPARHLIGVVMEGRAIPRPHDVVRCEQGEGEVTSGTFSPTLQKGIAMAYVPVGADAGTQVDVDIRGAQQPGKLESLPFYKPVR